MNYSIKYCGNMMGISIWRKVRLWIYLLHQTSFGTKYSRVAELKFVEDSLKRQLKSRPHSFIFFKGCLPQVLLGPFLNTLSYLVMKLDQLIGLVMSKILKTFAWFEGLTPKSRAFLIFQSITINQETIVIWCARGQ